METLHELLLLIRLLPSHAVDIHAEGVRLGCGLAALGRVLSALAIGVIAL